MKAKLIETLDLWNTERSVAVKRLEQYLKEQGCRYNSYTKKLFTVAEQIQHQKDINELLLYAARNNYVKVMDLAIEAGADIYYRPNNLCDVFEWATFDGCRGEVVECLIRHGFDIERTYRDFYPMHTAASAGNVAVMDVLAQYGASVNTADGFGHRPIHKAGNKTALFLLKAKADVNVQDNDGYTPLAHAAKGLPNPDLLKSLINARANPYIATKECKLPVALCYSPKNKSLLEAAMLLYEPSVQGTEVTVAGATSNHGESDAGHELIASKL